MTPGQAKSCGQNWTRCGKLKASGGCSGLYSASFDAENHVDRSAWACGASNLPCSQRDSDVSSIACGACAAGAQHRRRVVRHEIRCHGKHLTLTRVLGMARTLTACASLAANPRQSVLRDFVLRQDKVFLRRDCNSGTAGACFRRRGVLEPRRASKH